jgi:hypothetical protein
MALMGIHKSLCIGHEGDEDEYSTKHRCDKWSSRVIRKMGKAI